MRTIVGAMTFTLLTLCLCDQTYAERPKGHDLTAAGQGAIHSQDLVWITLGEDMFDLLRNSHGVLTYSLPPQALESDDGVVITQIPLRDLEAVSAFAHKTVHRCSGYIVHDSLESAQEALRAARHNKNLPAPVNFQIGQQALVQALMPEVNEANILSTITHLSTAYNNRYYQNATGEESALWIRDLWQSYAVGRSDVTVTTYNHSGYNQPSVILTIQGNSLASEVVVLGGHLDSILNGTNNSNTIAPGADDNASGIASLSEAIRVLLTNGFTPDRTIKFMGYAAEEVGLRGSNDIAADHRNAGTNVVAVMQLDMTAFKGSIQDIAFVDDYTNNELTAFTAQLVDTYQPSLTRTPTTCGYGCSDHASWHNRGFPAVYPFEAKIGEDNLDFHTPNDNLQTIGNSAAHALKFSRLALSFAIEIGMGDCTPGPIANAGADRTIAEGSSVQIGTAAQSGHTYSWSPGGSTSAQLTVAPAATTTYTVTATTSCGSAQDSVTVTVIPAGSNGPQDAVYNNSLGVPFCSVAGSECDSLALLNGRANLGPEPNQPNTLDGCADGTSGSFHSDESVDKVVISTLDNGNFSVGDTVQVDVTVYAYSTGSSDTLDLYYAADANNPSWVLIGSTTAPGGGIRTMSANYTLPNGSLQAVRAAFRYQGSAGTCTSGNYNDRDDLVFAVEGGSSNTAPNLTISAPSNGSSSTQGSSVSFSGSASDTEDGSLNGAISWTSSLDGNIGSGGSFSTSSLSVGSHTITASATDSGGLSGSAQVTITISGTGGGCSLEEDFESGAAGWINSGASTCVRGMYVLGTPTARSSGGVTTQVGGDHTTGSGNAIFTAFNTSAGANDVDRGNCIVESPVYAVNQTSELSLWYFHGQRDTGDDPSGDFFRLQISLDGGNTYSNLVAIGDVTNNAAWTPVNTTIPAGSNVKIRLQASDASGAGDLVEAGIDDLSICAQ